MNQDKKTLKIKALIFSVLRAKTQNLQTFSIFPGLELTFESLGTSLINLFGKGIFGKRRRQKSERNLKLLFVKYLFTPKFDKGIFKEVGLFSISLKGVYIWAAELLKVIQQLIWNS